MKRYILEGESAEIEKIIQENRIRISRGVVTFTPAPQDSIPEDEKEIIPSDTKEVIPEDEKEIIPSDTKEVISEDEKEIIPSDTKEVISEDVKKPTGRNKKQ